MFSFTLFNVGHGFCAYATTPGSGNMLFDCGYDLDLEFYPSRYFRDRNITYISSLFLSHFDQDHVANLPDLLSGVTFGEMHRNRTMPGAFVRSEKLANGQLTQAMQSALYMHETWISDVPAASSPDFGGVRVNTFTNPYPTFTDMNNLSLVAFLYYMGCGIVIPGDLEEAGWLKLLESPSFRQCLADTNFFIASHHGRNAGYCEKVFDYCKPDLVILSDKGVVHDSQEHDYAKHASGVQWADGSWRYVLTTRSDGHIQINKQAGDHTRVLSDVSL